MSNPALPTEQQTVTPYLILTQAGRFIDFTTTVFGATLVEKHQRTESDLIMHARIRIGNSDIMFADSNEQYPAQQGSLFIYVTNADDAYRRALQAGATAITEPADQDYGRSCGVADPCGNSWWITSILSSN